MALKKKYPVFADQSLPARKLRLYRHGGCPI